MMKMNKKRGLWKSKSPKSQFSYRAFGYLQESKKLPVPNCVTSNRVSNFFGNFWKFPGNFFETVSLVIGLESE